MERGWHRWMESAPEARAALVWHLARLDRTDALRADLRIPRWALATGLLASQIWRDGADVPVIRGCRPPRI